MRKIRKMEKKFLTALLSLTFALGVIIVASNTVQAQPRRGGTFVVGLTAEPTVLSSAFSAAWYDYFISNFFYNGLIYYDENYAPHPELAKSWEVSADGLRVTFHLRENVNFSDGEPFTSADVKFYIDEIGVGGIAPQRFMWERVDHGETPDEYTVVMVLKEPYGPVLSFMGGYHMNILPQHIYAGTDYTENPHNTANPIGTGPFLLDNWIRGDHLTMVRNPNYWKTDKPYLDQIIVKIIPDAHVAALAMEKGEIDYMPQNFPVSEVERFRVMSGVEVPLTYMAKPISTKLWMNLRKEPFTNLKVRQAINLAVDRKTIVDDVYMGMGSVANGPLCPDAGATAWACPDEPAVVFDYNPQRARELLDEAGYPVDPDTGYRFEMKCMTGTYRSLPEVCEVLTSNFEDVGIKFTYTAYEHASFVEAFYITHRFDFETAVFTIVCALGDPDYITNLYASWMAPQMVGYSNAMGLNDSIIDNNLKGEASYYDRDERAPYFYEVYNRMVEQAYEVSIIWMQMPQPYRTEFKGPPYQLPQKNLVAACLDAVYWVEGELIAERGLPGPPGEPAPVAAVIASVVLSIVAIVTSAYSVVKVRKGK